MILLIDNYDSFTWNLVQRLGEIDPSLEPGRDLLVVRADKISPAEADGLDGGRGPSHVIVSPGPCTPKEAGNSPALIEHFAGRVPILGVCLGHQCMADGSGMEVVRHGILMHGKTSEIAHDNQGILQNLPNPFTATRYHSLIVKEDTLPDCFVATSHSTDQNELMGIRHREFPVEGVQFHPESFLTPEGGQLLKNFLDI